MAGGAFALAKRELTHSIFLRDGVAAAADLSFFRQRKSGFNAAFGMKLVEQDDRVGGGIAYQTGAPLGTLRRAGGEAGGRTPVAH